MKERVTDLSKIGDLKIDYNKETKKSFEGNIRRGDLIKVNLGSCRTKFDDNSSIQAGERPAVVIQNNMGNSNSPTIIIAAITSSNKKDLPTHVHINSIPKASIILCEQLFTVDKSDVISKLGYITNDEYNKLNKALNVSLDLTKFNTRATTDPDPLINTALKQIKCIEQKIDQIKEFSNVNSDDIEISIKGVNSPLVIDELKLKYIELSNEKLDNLKKELSDMINIPVPLPESQEELLSDNTIVECYKTHTKAQTAEHFGITPVYVQNAATNIGFKKRSYSKH